MEFRRDAVAWLLLLITSGSHLVATAFSQSQALGLVIGTITTFGVTALVLLLWPRVRGELVAESRHASLYGDNLSPEKQSFLRSALRTADSFNEDCLGYAEAVLVQLGVMRAAPPMTLEQLLAASRQQEAEIRRVADERNRLQAQLATAEAAGEGRAKRLKELQEAVRELEQARKLAEDARAASNKALTERERKLAVLYGVQAAAKKEMAQLREELKAAKAELQAAQAAAAQAATAAQAAAAASPARKLHTAMKKHIAALEKTRAGLGQTANAQAHATAVREVLEKIQRLTALAKRI